MADLSLKYISKLRCAQKCLHECLVVQIACVGGFFGGGIAAQNELVDGFRVFSGLIGDLGGELFDEGVVHEEQGLRGDGGDVALAFDLGGAREVEGAEEFGDVVAHDRQVDRAIRLLDAEQAACDAVTAFAAGAGDLDAFGAVRGELTGELQERVAQRFEFEALRVLAPAQFIACIRMLGVSGGGEPIGAADHHRADHLFHAPAVLDETDGEMVEQLGMRGVGACDAEVIGCAHEAFAEKMLPEAVHHDA